MAAVGQCQDTWVGGSFPFTTNPLVPCELIKDYIYYLSIKYPQKDGRQCRAPRI